MNRIFAVVCAAVSLTACAGQQEMRQIAGSSATIMNDYRREMTAFAERQSALNADTTRRVHALGESREMSETYVRQRLLALKLAGDKNTLEMYDLLTAVPAADLLVSSPLLAGTASSAPPPEVKFDPAGVEKLTRQLNVLRKPPTYWDRINKIVAFRESLRQAYEESLEDATTETGGAIADAESVTHTMVPPTPQPQTRD